MAHVANCETCSATWDEMQQGQELALSIPTYRVSSDFHEGLTRRIEVGEGAADAIYQTAVPAATKVRYLLTGAAAAALLLVGFNTVMPRVVAPEAVTSRAVTSEAVASGAMASGAVAPEAVAPAEPTGQLVEVDRSQRHLLPQITWRPPGAQLAHRAPNTTWEPVTEATLAQTGANKCVESASMLRQRIHTLEGRAQFADDSWHELEEPVAKLRTAVEVMRWFGSRRLVELAPPAQEELNLAHSYINRAFGAESWEIRRQALQSLREVRFQRLQTHDVQAVCCRPPEDLVGELKELVERVPGAKQVFFIQSANGTAFTFQGPWLGGNRNGGLMIQVRVR